MMEGDFGLDVGKLFTVFQAVIFGATSVGRIFAFMPDVGKAQQSSKDYLTLVQRQPPIDVDSTAGKVLDKAKTTGYLKFNNVHFRYPTRPHIPVLKGITLEVKPGQFVALVGPSGCGKSTTIQLIERFYDAADGSITLDGEDIRSLTVTSYREAIGLVSQEPNLFDMTVWDNICLGLMERPSMERVIAAATKANIHEFIETLPQKYETKLGPYGGQLSGGQKQRLAIARALIKDPKM